MLGVGWLACAPPPLSVGTVPPLPQTDDTVRLVLLGDVGKSTTVQRAVAEQVGLACNRAPCDAIALLGDNSYPRGMRSAEDPDIATRLQPFVDLGVPVLLALGNHDYARGWNHRRAQWQLNWAQATPGVHAPGHVWSAHWPFVDVHALDTTRVFASGDAEQTRWLADKLTTSTTRWNIVLGHHPFRSFGPHGHAGSYEGWTGIPIVSGARLERLFQETLCGHADVYASGHDHNLQLLEHCGVSLIVSGSAASSTPLQAARDQALFASARTGFSILELPSVGPARVTFIDHEGTTLYEGRL